MIFPPDKHWRELEKIHVRQWRLGEYVIGRYISIHGGQAKVVKLLVNCRSGDTDDEAREAAVYYDCPPSLFFSLWPHVETEDFVSILCDSIDGLSGYAFTCRKAKGDLELFEIEGGSFETERKE